ncbi:MAG: hypothetical protein U0528_10350 [Anaerolineae bacterium]
MFISTRFTEIIVALFAGFAIGGVSGGLAVPVAGMIVTVLRAFVIEPMKTQAAPQMVDGKILLPRDERKDREEAERMLNARTLSAPRTPDLS